MVLHLLVMRWIILNSALCHVLLQNEDQRDDQLEVITDDEKEAKE